MKHLTSLCSKWISVVKHWQCCSWQTQLPRRVSNSAFTFTLPQSTGVHSRDAVWKRLDRATDSTQHVLNTTCLKVCDSQQFTGLTKRTWRGFRTSCMLVQEKSLTSSDTEKEVVISTTGILRRGQNKPVIDSAWAVRLANENGYLSWCRNTYILTGAGVTMMLTLTHSGHVAAIGAFAIAALNMLFGTLSFLYNTIVQRQRVQMSKFMVFVSSLAAILHWVFWCSVIIVFVSVEEEERPHRRFEHHKRLHEAQVQLEDQ